MLVVCSGGEVLCLKFGLGIVVDANTMYVLGREAILVSSSPLVDSHVTLAVPFSFTITSAYFVQGTGGN